MPASSRDTFDGRPTQHRQCRQLTFGYCIPSLWVIYNDGMQWIGVIVAAGVGMLLLERVAPARSLPRVPGFWPRAIALNALQAGVVVLAGFTWERWVGGASLLHLGAWPIAVAALAGYAVSSFVYYWWHRARHEVPALWCVFHQVHHSTRRIEVFAALYKHPSEFVVNSILSTWIAYPLLGLTPDAAGLLSLFTAVAEFFYHSNIRTPRWVGWIIQRPEMHRVHHQRNRHRMNYADLPLVDLVFGTFHNPRRGEEVECGFEPLREQRFAAMLAGRDVNRPRHRRNHAWQARRAA